MEKRGLSAVVAVMIFVLLVLVAIAIIWFFIQRALDDSTGQIGTEKFTTKLDIDDDSFRGQGCNLMFNLNRPAGAGNIEYLRFVLTSSTGETEVVDYPVEDDRPLEIGELETIQIHITEEMCSLEDVVLITVTPIFEGDNLGNTADEEEVGGVCGNGILEYGEECDGNGLCFVDGPIQYLGTGTCDDSCEVVSCDANPLCSNGFDDDFDGSCDYQNYGQCLPAGSFPDNGCISADDDETPAKFAVSILSPSQTNYNILSFPANLDLSFRLSLTTGSILPIDVESCSYSLTRGGIIVDSGTDLSECDSIDQSASEVVVALANQLSIGEDGSYNLEVVTTDATGDMAVGMVDFSVTHSNIQITNPVAVGPGGDPYETLEFSPIIFALENFEAESCSYSVFDERQNISAISETSISCTEPQDISSLGEGYYTVRVYASNMGGTIFDSRFFVYDFCAGNIGGNETVPTVNGLDLGILQGNWGCTGNPGECIGDINGNGMVGNDDLGILLSNWGQC